VVRHHRAESERLGREDEEEDGEEGKTSDRPTDKFRILLLSEADGETLGKKDILAVLHQGEEEYIQIN